MPKHTNCIHFVGFRGEEYWAAVKVWGKPDGIHLIHDMRMYGDVGEGDIIIFGPKAGPELSEYNDQDHERH
jgi:hypothetical protein